ncbi:MAG: hypothetical protein CBC48_00090 [bacterium TMED88]|nr:MAG: hypothetical protein CBC48_00090 [bacterium TMED88]
MLSIEKKSFSVTLERFKTNNPNYSLGLHFLLPDIEVPLHCSNLVKQGEQIELKSNTRIFGIVTLQHHLQKHFERFIFIPEYNKEQNHTFGSYNITTFLTTPNFESTKDILPIPNFDQLSQYVSQSLHLIKSSQPVDKRLEKIHSVSWSFDLLSSSGNVKVHVPYVCLVCRGDALVNNLKTTHLLDLQHFFMREMTNICNKATGFAPSNFIQMSKKALQDNNTLHSVYIAIANLFSSLVHKHIEYMTDYKATGKKDFVGINEFGSQLYSDCEDMAQASFDLMRVFRRLFPSSLNDVNDVSTLCYHIAAWLNDSTLGVMQGAIGEARGALNNHVWAAILPKQTPPVFVDGTNGEFVPRIYQYAVRFWSRDPANIYDFFFINPDTGQYGMPANFLLSHKSPMKIIDTWSLKLNTANIYADLLFAANIQVETFNILNYLIKQ